MVRPGGRCSVPLLAALGTVAVTLGGLLVGYEPIGGDPDILYRPIKSELARALRAGTLPLWSDRFGVGTPLAAESHAAAFYPPNWLLYRALSVEAAYRLAMWSHYLALAAATYWYARTLQLTPWGAALAALAFSLCGFQAGHACHEPFYHLLPFLPLALGLTEHFLADGRRGWLAALALALGVQITTGHYQFQAWTAALVVLTVLWRALGKEAPWRRGAGVLAALAWGLAIAALPIALTLELTRVVGFNRPFYELLAYAYPPAYWAQPALPALYARAAGPEACLYVGTVPLILAGAGWPARRDRALGPWRWLTLLGVVLATMPNWSRVAYYLWSQLPVIGHFRAPGRYTLLTSLGLCLLAGRGLDRSRPSGGFWAGYGLALAFGAAAVACWGMVPPPRDVVAALEGAPWGPLLAAAGATWLVALGVVAAWRAGWAPPWLPFLVAACELAYLYPRGATPWGPAVRYREESPVLRRLVAESGVQRVTGRVRDLPVRLGLTTADPLLGITPPPPNYLLESFIEPSMATHWNYRVWMRRFGITHGVLYGDKEIAPAKVLYQGDDAVLDATLLGRGVRRRPRSWRLECYGEVFPEARAAVRVRSAENWYKLFSRMSRWMDPDEVWFVSEDLPPDPPGPRARSARVLRWDGRSGVVEHDGTCDLVLLRAYYPGWSARIDGGPEVPVARADCGFQAVRLRGAGRTHVSVRYRPTHLGRWTALSLGSAAAALATLGASVVPRPGRRRPAAHPDAATR